MSDYERRQELLNQMKRHPTYDKTAFGYGKDTKPAQKSTFGLRVMICVVCFICYVLFDYGDMKLMNVNSKVITHQISQQVNLHTLIQTRNYSKIFK